MKAKSAFCAAQQAVVSALADFKTECSNDTLKIIVAVIFNLDPAAFFSVMNRNVGAEVLLQLVLQIFNRGRAGG